MELNENLLKTKELDFFFPSKGIHAILTKLGKNDAKTLKMLNCEGIFDILNNVAMARELLTKKEKQKESHNSAFSDLDVLLYVCS